MSVSENCLEKIKSNEIKPASRFGFVARETILKLAIPFFILISIFLVTIIILSIAEIDFDAYRYMNVGFGEFVLTAIPYLSILLLCLTVYISIQLFRNTEYGYKVDRTKLIFVGCIVMTFGTTTVFVTRLSEALNNAVEENLPLVQVFKHHKYYTWSHPDKGLLAGKLETINDFDLLEVRDLNSQLWLINTSKILRFPIFHTGKQYKFLGVLDTQNKIFFASEAREWK